MREVLFFVSIILFSQTLLNAQKTATWKGGTPGKPSEWNCATNWREGRVPNEFSDVVIPSILNHTYPVISTSVDDINALFLASEASLRIDKKGALTVYERAEIAPGSMIQNHGVLSLPMHEISNPKGQGTVLLAKNATKQEKEIE